MINCHKIFALCLLTTIVCIVIIWVLSSKWTPMSSYSTLLAGERNLTRSSYLHKILSRLVPKEDRNSSDEGSISSIVQLQNKGVLLKCPDILSGMVKGHWVTRPLTPLEQVTIDGYLREERAYYKIPPTYQRLDGRCADVPYELSPLYNHMWFKSICDPKGATPCCRNNSCVQATEEDCRCAACYDERQVVHAEFSLWKPTDDSCNVKNFTQKEACHLLNGTTLHFVGDSFMRHVFAALVIVLTNQVDGALVKNLPSFVRAKCEGMFQITGAFCRDYLDQNRTLCDGTAKITYTQVFPSSEINLALPILRHLSHVNKSLVVIGLGIHDNFNLTTVVNKFLLPFLKHHQTLSNGRGNDEKIKMTLKNPASQSLPTGSTGQSLPTGPQNKQFHDVHPQILNNFDFHRQKIQSFNQTFNKIGLNVYKALDTNYKISHQESQNYLPKIINQKCSTDDKMAENMLNSNSSHLKVNNKLNVFENMPTPGVNRHTWPRMLWIGTHAPGLLKSPKFQEQTAEGVQHFNHGVYKILSEWKVPYLDTYAFTNGTVSFDGTHYGWGVNMLKVNMILSYIQRGVLTDEV